MKLDKADIDKVLSHMEPTSAGSCSISRDTNVSRAGERTQATATLFASGADYDETRSAANKGISTENAGVSSFTTGWTRPQRMERSIGACRHDYH